MLFWSFMVFHWASHRQSIPEGGFKPSHVIPHLMWTCSLFLSISFSSHTLILSPQISPAFNSETSGPFCQMDKANVCQPDWVLVPSSRANYFCSHHIVFGHSFTLGHTRYSCGCACVGVPTSLHQLPVSGEAEAMLKPTSDAFRVWNWCLCCRLWETARGFAATKAAG